MSSDNRKIRKQVYKLTSVDLTEHPIWEFCPDEEDAEGQDEATVKLSTDQEILGYSPGVYVLAAEIMCADGTQAAGYLYSGEPDDFGCLQPNVLLADGQVNLWLGSLRFMPKWKESVAERSRRLSGDHSFPMSFQTTVHVNGAPLRVVVEGFLARDLNDRIVVVG